MDHLRKPSGGSHFRYRVKDRDNHRLVPVHIWLRDRGYTTWCFEGPGQGEAMVKYNLPMTNEWEKPVKAVLDHFNLKDVTLIGLSPGAYLALRAALNETRISRVICWGMKAG